MTSEELQKYFGASGAETIAIFVELQKKVPSIADVVSQPHIAEIPTDPIALGVMVQLLSDYSKTEDASIVSLVTYGVRLPRFYAAIFFREVYAADIKGKRKLVGNVEFERWFREQQKLFEDTDVKVEPVTLGEAESIATAKALQIENRLIEIKFQLKQVTDEWGKVWAMESRLNRRIDQLEKKLEAISYATTGAK